MRTLLVGSLLVNVALVAWVMSPADTLAPEDAAGALTSCETETERLTAQLEAFEAELLGRLSLAELFERGAPDPALEARLAPRLDPLLAEEKHRLTCRGSICKVEVRDRAGSGGRWRGALAEVALAAPINRQAVERVRQLREPKDATLWEEYVVFLELAPWVEVGR